MKNIRQQLTLFISPQSNLIEQLRLEFNPVQYNLIAAHVTLCREDEIGQLAEVIKNIKSIQLKDRLRIDFNPIERFDEGRGLLIPARTENESFYLLRSQVLKGLYPSPRKILPHITLMHPRNSVCTTQIFNKLKNLELPKALYFDKISLIEQVNGEKWQTIDQFSLI